MKILVIGSGGREHALIWKIAQSPRVEKIYCAPGNAGIKNLAECVDLSVENIEGCVKFAKDHAIDLTVVGPEVPLVMGIADAFSKENLSVFAPNGECSQFEGSKVFTKKFLERHQIPTAAYKEYTKSETLLQELGLFGYPMVLKADGLAAGKGVLIVENAAEAKDAVKLLMEDKAFGKAGEKVVIEEFLTGQEASMLCFVDGETIVPMESAQDYKRAYDGDKGLNTGGMGTYSPNILFEDDHLNQKIRKTILDPIMAGFKKDHMDYKGILFIGLMIKEGIPKVLEFNVRFGDPETQSILMRLDTDLVDIMEACVKGQLDTCPIGWKKEAAVTVVLASGGYPEKYQKGYEITGIDQVKGCQVFHAGTTDQDGKLVTNGGRVLCVSALASTREDARKKVYDQIDKIKFEGVQYRTDIAACK